MRSISLLFCGLALSRVVLPAQETESGHAQIRLTAIEGHINDIEYVGDYAFVMRFKAYFAPAASRPSQRAKRSILGAFTMENLP